MRSWFLLLALAAFGFAAHANDSNSSGIGGTWRMLKGEHRQIQMVREHVRIGSYKTTADFVFRNHGPATTVTMGFPETGGGDSSPHLSFRSFASWVDGRRVKTRRKPLPHSESQWGALWIKRVRFGRNATRRVRVQYVSNNGGGDSSGYIWVAYQFTGGNWRGKVKESILDVELSPGTYLFPDLHKLPLLWRRDNRFRFRWRNWQAQQDFQFTYMPLFPNDLLPKKPTILTLKNAKPHYYRAWAYDQTLPLFPTVQWVPDAVLQKGRLWVSTNSFAPIWDAKNRAVILRLNGQRARISIKGAVKQSSLWPLAPNGCFWISYYSNVRQLMVPARQIARAFNGRFELDFKKSRALFVTDKKRLEFGLNGDFDVRY
jgi:hypothetical protein